MDRTTTDNGRTDDAMNAPRTETEKRLVEMWSAILKVNNVGIYDDFLCLGGHSLSAILCINQIKGLYAVELPLDAFFSAAHIAELASQIDTMRGESTQVARGSALQA